MELLNKVIDQLTHAFGPCIKESKHTSITVLLEMRVVKIL